MSAAPPAQSLVGVQGGWGHVDSKRSLWLQGGGRGREQAGEGDLGHGEGDMGSASSFPGLGSQQEGEQHASLATCTWMCLVASARGPEVPAGWGPHRCGNTVLTPLGVADFVPEPG